MDAKRYSDKVKHRRQIRSRARKELFDQLYLDHGGKCYWCGVETVRLRHLVKTGRKVMTNMAEASWKAGYVTIVMPIATIDHLKDLARGGTNERSNIVLSCFRCNYRRSGKDGTDRELPATPWKLFDPSPRTSKQEY